jgi:hypothetical protein
MRSSELSAERQVTISKGAWGTVGDVMTKSVGSHDGTRANWTGLAKSWTCIILDPERKASSCVVT